MPQRFRWHLLATGVVLSAISLYACSLQSLPSIDTEGRSTPAPGSAVGADAGNADGGAAATSCFGGDAGCNDLQLCGQQAFLTQVASNAPASVGGAISAGLYTLTGYKLYTGPSGAAGTSTSTWVRQTIELLPMTGVDAGADDAGISYSFAWSNAIATNAASQANQGGTVLASGSSFTMEFDFTCGNATNVAGTYTATASTIVFYLVSPGEGTAEYTYTLTS